MVEKQKSESGAAAWRAAREHLSGKKQRILEEIRAYPPPIPACDLQFNGLLEQRDAISRKLERLGEIQAAGLEGPDAVAAINGVMEAPELSPTQPPVHPRDQG